METSRKKQTFKKKHPWLYWRTVLQSSIEDDKTFRRRTVQILHYSFRIGNELRRDFQKNISPLPGVHNLYKQPSFRRKSFSPRLISSGGKMGRMPMPCAMGLALECFQKIIPSKGMIF